MWKWDDALGNKWARVAMCSQRLNIPINMPEGIKEERRGTSWARATRELRRLRHRIEAVGGSKDQWEAGVWHMDKEQWNLLWTGEQAFWKAVSFPGRFHFRGNFISGRRDFISGHTRPGDHTACRSTRKSLIVSK